MTEPEPGVAVVTLRLRVNRVPAEVFLTALTTIGKEAQVAVDALTKICEQIEAIGELVEGDLFEKVEEEGETLRGRTAEEVMAVVERPSPPSRERAPPPSGPPSRLIREDEVPPKTSISPPPPPPPPPPPVRKEPHIPEADVPEGSPEWLAPALKHAKAAKARLILKQLATDGNLTVQSVIYAFHPPIKEAYAQNVLSDVKQTLGQVGWTLERDNTGAYRAIIKQGAIKQ